MADLARIRRRLREGAAPIDQLRAPAKAGVYAIFRRPLTQLPLLPARLGADDPIYIGISGNLAEREFETHFASGQSGFSTLRRSLGAVLVGQLELRPQPRGRGSSESNYRNYRFDDHGEDRLSEWMTDKLRVAVAAVAEPGRTEGDLIALAQPQLNLTHWPNPDRPMIRAARGACIDAARGGISLELLLRRLIVIVASERPSISIDELWRDLNLDQHPDLVDRMVAAKEIQIYRRDHSMVFVEELWPGDVDPEE